MDVQRIPQGRPITLVGEDPPSRVDAMRCAADDDMRYLLTQMLTDAVDRVLGVPRQAPDAVDPPGECISLVQTGASSWRIFADRR